MLLSATIPKRPHTSIVGTSCNNSNNNKNSKNRGYTLFGQKTAAVVKVDDEN